MYNIHDAGGAALVKLFKGENYKYHIKIQFVPHRKHSTSPPQLPSG
jgi:hypothetical protein